MRISGQPIAGTPPHKRDVNTVFQAYALFPHMTVAENVAYGLRQRGVGKADMGQRVAEALDMVKMRPLAERKPKQLSGGQQQRVALARALVNRPSLLLLDEPLGALDRKLREEMQIELKLLQSQLGITFIFVTHDQEEALSMSDRIAVMLDGRIEQLGDPYTIYEHPTSAFVAGFIGQQNFFRGRALEGGARHPVGRSHADVQSARRRAHCRHGCAGGGSPGGDQGERDRSWRHGERRSAVSWPASRTSATSSSSWSQRVRAERSWLASPDRGTASGDRSVGLVLVGGRPHVPLHRRAGRPGAGRSGVRQGRSAGRQLSRDERERKHMSDLNEPIKILAPPEAAQRISRRLFMGGAAGAAVGGSALLAACGEDSTTDTNAAPAGEIESELNMFTWGEYNAPKVIKTFENRRTT